MDKLLSIDDHFEVKSSLENLNPEQLRDLGGALGLRYPKLRRMTNILDDMTAAWLNKEDNVLDKSGEPTWNRLVEALEKVGQKGVAEDIMNEKSSSETEQKMPTKDKWKNWRWYLVAGLFILLIVSSLYIYWPTITYTFNLYHSKTLPYISKNFVGREEDMKEVTRLVDFKNNDIRIMNIIGPPGFGKSTLAIHVGHEMVRKGVVVYYFNVAEFSDKAVKLTLAEKFLDNSNTVVYKQVTFERFLTWVRDCFWNTLLILDNCDEVLNKQGDEFHDAIMKIVQESLNVKVMVTSRRVATFTKYYKWFKVKELTMAAACELLDRKIPTKIKLSLEEKEQIANLTGNVPLALQIIGSLLHLPNSPLPCVIIRQLKEELILTLSSKDLPRQEQAYASISISYRYLSEEMQVGGHQLTIFPGSFNQEAVTGIFFFNTTTQCDQYQYFAQKSYELTSFLVRSSLLEHNERTNRYRYHILIKQYFLLLQQKEKSLNTTKHMPAFHVHYAKQLVALSRTFPNFPDDSLAFLDLEHHNIQFLLMHTLAMKPDSKSSILTEEFLETTIALSTAIDMSLLDLRFTRKTLCKLVQHALTQFDKVVHHLELYLQLSRQNFTQKEALNVYLRLINQQATCEQELHGVQRAVKVYTHRRHIIKSKNGSVDFKEYINFFMKLSNYFRQLGFDTEVAECHRIIIQRTKADLEMCKPNQCNYYDIGQAYYAMNRYEDAAKFFEMSYETESHTMNKAAAVVRLAHTYNKLNDHGRENETIAKLHEIYSCITDAFLGSDLTIDGEAVQIVIIDLFRKAGLEAEANHLEIKFIGSYNNIIREMNVTTTKHSDCCCNTKCIPVTSNHLLTRGVNVLRHLNKQENFTQVIELGTFLRGNIQGSNSLEYYLLIEVSLLIGKAKYYTVSYSQGMDEMEHALQTILDQPGYYTWTQMSTACYYLIPRLVYIDTCYHFSTVLKDVIHVIIYLLFSPYPLNLGKPEDNQNNQSISEKTDIISHTTELATIGGPLSTVLNPLWSHYQKLTQSTTESVQKVYLSFDNLLGPLVKLKNMLNAPMCVLVTWAKLMLYCTLFFLSEEQIVFTMLPILEIFQFIILFATNPSLIMHIRPIMRYARDPRYRYGDDSSIYIGKIDMIMRDSLI